MTKILKYFGLILLGMILFQNVLAQTESAHDSKVPEKNPLFSRLHTLSIHVRDTITHDSVFHFLVDELKLPVYYYPVTYGKRKYAGVYAGNLVLEPCGPYSDFSYATNDFRAIFFGLTFESSEPLTLAAMALADRKIKHQIMGDEAIYFHEDSALCGDNITISFMDKKNDKINDKRKMDSLRYAMNADTESDLGIEYVKEIRIGYKDSPNLQKWKDLISPVELINNEIWKESNILDFHFIKSNIKEVQSITFKVRSLEKAKEYLLKNNLAGSFIDSKIQLNKSKTFGLSIYLTGED